MSKDDDLLAKAAALAPKPKRKKKAGAVLPPGGEPPTRQAQPDLPSLPQQRTKQAGPRKRNSMRNI